MMLRDRRHAIASLVGAAGALAWPLSSSAQTAVSSTASSPRVALLVGNRNYPDGQDLPSMHTNARQLQAALDALGFTCTVELDLGRADAVQAVDRFARMVSGMPADTVVFFYFCGHGMQIDAENFLIPSHVLPRYRQLDQARSTDIDLARYVRTPIPRRSTGLTMLVIDACRTSPKPLAVDDGFNQVRAMPGEVVVFSTGAGRPALAPIDERRMTFFTDALVRRLKSLVSKPEDLSFTDLFRLVSGDVQRTMRSHPVEDIRALTQVPFIADNSGVSVRVSLKPPEPPPPTAAELKAEAQRRAAEEQVALDALRNAWWPRDVRKLATSFMQAFPDSRFANVVQLAADGAELSAQVLDKSDISLQRQDFQPRPEASEAYNEDLRRASRGDKDAAARMAARVRPSQFNASALGLEGWLQSAAKVVENALPVDAQGPSALRYEGWMQYAAELGDGIAAYELAMYYNKANRPALVGRWITRAKKLGYVPPPSLRITR